MWGVTGLLIELFLIGSCGGIVALAAGQGKWLPRAGGGGGITRFGFFLAGRGVVMIRTGTAAA